MECGSCNLCCILPKLPELNKEAGITCKYLCNTCTIYDNRPDACKEFSCAYHQMDKVSEKLRPDNCGIIFEKLAPDLMFGSVNPTHKDFSFVHGQIQYFLKEGINVVLSNNITYHLDNIKPEDLLTRVYKITEG